MFAMGEGYQASLRDASSFLDEIRGLKPTAKVETSLRDGLVWRNGRVAATEIAMGFTASVETSLRDARGWLIGI